MSQNPEAVRLLLEAGADVYIPLQNGVTPLMSAVGGGSVEMVKLILEKRPDLDSANDQGYTALRVAREAKRSDLVDLLESHGATK
jgi:ankyrin repeat protein